MRCAITGSSGYVGSAIARYFSSRGWDILALGRRGNGNRVAWDLSADPRKIPWQGVDALVHCAYDFHCAGWDEIRRVNVDGSIALLEAAKEQGVSRRVFISSVSSFEGCRSLYGKAKLQIEAAALAMGCAVVRPGLVYGENPGGVMASLQRAASAAPVLPMIGDGSYPQYLVHDEDLARLVFLLCQKDARFEAKPITAANPEKIPLRDIIRRIAARKGRRVHFIPIPWQLILLGLKTAEALRLPAPFRSDSLVGMIFQNPAPDFYEGPEVAFRSFE
jgi:nucleoside-diphosphate-sugar epimerase